MKVFYIKTKRYCIGCFNKEKLEKMYKNSKIEECDISEFSGQLLSSEYLT